MVTSTEEHLRELIRSHRADLESVGFSHAEATDILVKRSKTLATAPGRASARFRELLEVLRAALVVEPASLPARLRRAIIRNVDVLSTRPQTLESAITAVVRAGLASSRAGAAAELLKKPKLLYRDGDYIIRSAVCVQMFGASVDEAWSAINRSVSESRRLQRFVFAHYCQYEIGRPSKWSYSMMCSTSDEEFSEHVAGDYSSFEVWQTSQSGKAELLRVRQKLDELCADKGVSTERDLQGRIVHRWCAVTAQKRRELRRATWRALTGKEASAELQRSKLFQRTPEGLLMNGAAQLMYFCDGPGLTAAPTWGEAPALLVTARMAWLRAHELLEAFSRRTICFMSRASFNARLCGNTTAFDDWCQSAEGHAALLKERQALAAKIKSLGCEVPKKLRDVL